METGKNFNPKALMTIRKQSIVGVLLYAGDYKTFCALLKNVANVADTFGEVEKEVAIKVAIGTDMKAVIDATARPIKDANKEIRGFLTQYMVDNKLSKIEGKEIKSITLQEAKTTKSTVSKKQIMVGRAYKDLSELSKDDLVEMLEEKGVKTRVEAHEVEVKKENGIRVQK